MTVDDVADLKEGNAHLDPEGLCLLRSRDNATVIVGEHDDRATVQTWLENALAGRVKIIAIDETKRRHGAYRSQ